MGTRTIFAVGIIRHCRHTTRSEINCIRAFAKCVQHEKDPVLSAVEQYSKSGDNSDKGDAYGEKWRRLRFAAGLAFASTAIFSVRWYHDEIETYLKSILFVSAAKKKKEETTATKPSLTSRELRFLTFASVEYEGQIFMTPRDFLNSVTQMQPVARQQRRELDDGEVKRMLKKTPTFDKGSKDLFRQLNDGGLISYTEYLFLLCVLTKPASGFRIAFNMFDTDGNQKVDKKEFLVLDAVPQEMLNLVKDTSLNLRKSCKHQLEPGAGYQKDLETVFASSRRQKRELELRKFEQATGSEGADQGSEDERSAEDEIAAIDPKPQETNATQAPTSMWSKTAQILETMRVQDTTLLVHFFGKKGKKTLTYDDFYKFMENLQTEVLETEFLEFSRGKPTITESEFATILLRYTVARPDDFKAYMDRVREKIPDEKGITFEQFKKYCQFLTNLDDFSIAVKLYTFADLPVSQAEFARAVKVSTGHALDPHVVDTVFQIFDVNDDGRLSYSEFIAVMRDRLHRGSRTRLVKKEGWEAFKSCIRAEMKRY